MVTTRGAEGRVATSSSSHTASLANMSSSNYHVSDWKPFFFPFRPPPSTQGDTTDQSPTTVSAKPLSLSTSPMAEPGLHSTRQCHGPVPSPGSLTVETDVWTYICSQIQGEVTLPRSEDMKRLLELPVARDLHFDVIVHSPHNSSLSSTKLTSLVIQITGDELDKPCSRCHRGDGPFACCVRTSKSAIQTALGLFGNHAGACANCLYNKVGRYCSVRHGYRSFHSQPKSRSRKLSPPPKPQGNSCDVPAEIDVGEDSATSPRRSGRLHMRKKSFSSSATVPDEVDQAVNKGKSAGTKVASSQRPTKLVLRRNRRASSEPASDLTNTAVDTPTTPRRSERLFIRSDSHGSPSAPGRRPRRIRIVTKKLREKQRGITKSKSRVYIKKIPKQDRRERSTSRRNRLGSASQNSSSTYTDQVPLTTGPEPSTTSTGLSVPQEDLEMEDWEFGEGRVLGSEDGSSSSNLGFAPNFISTRPNIQVRDKIVFSSISIPSGNMQRFEIDPEKTRVCSLISGKVTVQVDGESQFKVGPQGMFPVQPGVSCTVLNNCYAVAVLHVTSVKEGH
ncbi:hypothetical protein QBC46DRAFT_431153 [Diplogelasinospora grovesii]|uniref:Uncharacterized protein n=1 Tax=Diplogelasinospora grovesii TaxID=303347 RepID=A0AAN6S631_9PEZI|nr:hypothetical protein QBC46DRAFT_431153 [Diplogelasinospora grovesii]